jgi:hypothetical protein
MPSTSIIALDRAMIGECSPGLLQTLRSLTRFAPALLGSR